MARLRLLAWGLAGFLFTGCGDCLYKVSLRNFGDRYDVERLVKAANLALRRAGFKEQYVVLAGGGQTAEFLFGHPAAIQKLSDELYLPLGDDLNRAMREGKEFEQKVIDSLGEGEGG